MLPASQWGAAAGAAVLAVAAALALSPPAQAATETECADFDGTTTVTLPAIDLTSASGMPVWQMSIADGDMGGTGSSGDSTIFYLEAQDELGTWRRTTDLTFGALADGFAYPLVEQDVGNEYVPAGANVRGRIAVGPGAAAGVALDDACLTIFYPTAPATQTVAISQAGTDNDVDSSGGGGGSGGALTASQSDGLNLVWQGVWALVGLVLILMIAPGFLRVLDVRQGMGGRFERG